MSKQTAEEWLDEVTRVTATPGVNINPAMMKRYGDMRAAEEREKWSHEVDENQRLCIQAQGRATKALEELVALKDYVRRVVAMNEEHYRGHTQSIGGSCPYCWLAREGERLLKEDT